MNVALFIDCDGSGTETALHIFRRGDIGDERAVFVERNDVIHTFLHDVDPAFPIESDPHRLDQRWRGR